MDKVKIQEIADEAGLSNADLLEKANELGFKVKAANSTISMENAGILVDYAISGTLPKGFKRIRFYGLLSNRYKKENIKRIRKLLNDSNDTPAKIKEKVPELILLENDNKAYKCPECQSADVIVKEIPVDYLTDYWNTS